MTITALSPLKLHALGYSVIPSGGGESGKSPIVDWKQYQTELPTEAKFEAWQNRYNPSLWGVVTGPVSGIFVIDCDDPEALTLFGNLKPHIKTPRGFHFWFRYPQGKDIQTNAGILPHIDIRGRGGFVNCIGTRKDGGKYECLITPTPDAVYPWEKLPAPILKALQSSKVTGTNIPVNSKKNVPIGERNDYLTSLAGTMRRRGMAESAIKAALIEESNTWDNPLDESEIAAIAGSIKRYEPAALPQYTPVKPGGNGHKDTEPPSDLPALKPLSEVQPVAVTWLWYPYIPLGKFTLIEGDPGIGKSWAALAIATAITTRGKLPGQDSPFDPFESCYVLLATGEDGMADTIRPRLDKMGANVNFIYYLDGLFTLDKAGMHHLESKITEMPYLPMLVIIDPLVAYLAGDVDIHKANQVRQVTARLAKLADNYGCAILAIRHLTKSSSAKAIYRGSGSIDFTASARSVLSAGRNDDGRGFVHVKSNLAPEGPAIGFDIKEDGFYWMQNCTLTKEEIMSNTDNPESARATAENYLHEILDGAGPVESNRIIKEAKDRDIKIATLYRAKSELGIVSTIEGKQDGKGGRSGSFWELK